MLAGAAVVTGGGAASTARASAGIATLRIVRVTTGRVTTGRATTEARNRADQRKAAPVTSDVSFRRGMRIKERKIHSPGFSWPTHLGGQQFRQMPRPALLTAPLTRPKVYTHLSNPGPQPLVPNARSPAGNEWKSSQDVPQRLVGGLGDSNPHCNFDPSGAKAILPNPQARTGQSEIGSVVARPGNSEGFGQAAGAAGQPKKI